MERKRKLTRRQLMTRAAKGAAVTGGGIAAVKWATPTVATVNGSTVSTGSPAPRTKCYAVKVDPFGKPKFEDLHDVEYGEGRRGPNHCLPETSKDIDAGGPARLVGYSIDILDKKHIEFTLPKGCKFAVAYSKASGCDLHEDAAKKGKYVFEYYTPRGKQQDVSNLQFVFCCPA